MNAGILMMIFIILIANIGGIYFYLQDKKAKLSTKTCIRCKSIPTTCKICTWCKSVCTWCKFFQNKTLYLHYEQ